MRRSTLLWIVTLGATAVARAAEPPKLDVYAELKQAPGNVTLTPDGRVIASLHQFYATPMRVVEVAKDGTLTPFPDADWNNADIVGRPTLDAVLGIRCDANGVVWMLDNALRGKSTPKLVGWNTKTNRLERIIYLPPPITVAKSFVNDMAIDSAAQTAYIVDPAGAKSALIVVDLKTGEARRVLEGHPSAIPEDVDLVIDGRTMELKQPDGSTQRARVGADPVALDSRNEWLYFGPMSGKWLYRVKTADLRDASLSVAALAQRVERYAEKPLCDGISMDNDGNIYISDVARHALGVITPARKYETLCQDDRLLSWPDAMSYGPDGMMYVVANQLQNSPVLNGGVDRTTPLFYIVRFRPLAAGVVGR